MGGKFSPVIIIVLVLVVVAIGALIFQVYTTGSVGGDNGKQQTAKNETVDTKPLIKISKEFEEGSVVSEVKLVVTATTEDEGGITEIIKFGKESVKTQGEEQTVTIEHTVTENGTYSFTAYNSKGEFAELAIEVNEITESSAENPYIPEGFSYLEGTVDEGYVITDQYGNEFVWIPVESGIPIRFMNINMDLDYVENNNKAKELVNSIGKYKGFYFGRYEASEYISKDGVRAAGTMANKVPLTNINYQEAYDASINAKAVFEYEDVETTLMNSYAWDTALQWIDKGYGDYSTTYSYGNYSGTIYPTGAYGTDRVKNIFDIAGNVREWTTEEYKETNPTNKKGRNASADSGTNRVVRGGSASLSRTPQSHIAYPETNTELYRGFRVVLYKQIKSAQ